jgi:hypothetical protein
VARFGNANEHGDWETAHHVFTYANALHQMLKRIGTTCTDGHVTGVRGILHGAMALYLTRYLNVPPARIPGEGDEQLDDLPADVETIRAGLLDAFDRQRQVDAGISDGDVMYFTLGVGIIRPLRRSARPRSERFVEAEESRILDV